MRAAEKTAEKRFTEYQKEISELKRDLRKKEQDVTGLYEAQKLQNKQSERALLELKKEMQNNTDRLYKEVQQQVLALEEELEKAAHDRDKIEIEYNKRVNEERLKCDETVSTLVRFLCWFGFIIMKFVCWF